MKPSQVAYLINQSIRTSQYCIILHPSIPKLVLNVYDVKQVDDDDDVVRKRRH